MLYTVVNLTVFFLIYYFNKLSLIKKGHCDVVYILYFSDYKTLRSITCISQKCKLNRKNIKEKSPQSIGRT